MKKIKLALILLCSVMMCLGAPVLAAETEAQTEAQEEEPALNYKKLNLFKGQRKRLKVANTEKTITWTSSRPKVATVSKKGLVKCLSKGRTTITAKFGKQKLTCVVRVKLPELELNRKRLTLKTGVIRQLKVTKLTGPKTDPEDIKWKSSNRKVALVSVSGNVTARKAGTCNITATINNVTATVKLTVKDPVQPKIELDQTTLYLSPGEDDYLEATLTGKPDKSSYTWTSSNKKVVTISEATENTCKVEAVGVGSATIKVKYGTLEDTCHIVVMGGNTGEAAVSVRVDRQVVGGYETDYAIGLNAAGGQLWRVELAKAPAAQGYLAEVVKYHNYIYAITMDGVSVLNPTNGQPIAFKNLSIGASPVACVDNNGYLYVTGGLAGNTHTVYRLLFANNKDLMTLWSTKLNANFLEPYAPYVQGSYLYLFDDGYFYTRARINIYYGTVDYYR